MSQVDKIMAKALSTASEDEAIAALRIARKKYTGGEVKLGSQPADTVSVGDYTKLRSDALEIQKWAKQYRAERDYYKSERDHEKRQAQYYFELYNTNRLDYNITQDEIRKLKRKVTEKSSHRITNLMIGFLVGFFLSGLVMHLTGLGV